MTTTDKITRLLDNYPASTHVFISRERKPQGGHRRIVKPNKELRKWLHDMNKALVALHGDWPAFMHGGIKKRSYLSYARPHVNKACVITVDIAKCFDSITSTEILAALRQHTDLPDDICKRLVERLCFKGSVPQGFATSNFLCNLYLLEPFTGLQQELSTQDIQLTNYVDDLAASGIIANQDEIINQIVLTLSRAKLKTNKAKIVVMRSSQQQVICGLVVNKRLSLSRQFKLKLMSDLAHHRMGEASADGWVANLHGVDPEFGKKFYVYALKKGVLKPKAL